ncbi:UDP-N-acetylglucosamine 2-epimerase (non-hydrolyzing) [bacterium]|nr:MAG: UDP-N-acetylglucosamine 2-epimerase (non-hydrolyzing) [bacterium]
MEPVLVHTGQHYDENMSKVFFEDLELPTPDIYLGVGSGTHAEQTGKVMISFEKVLSKEKPDLVIVVGDVNSTLACSLVAAKMMVPVAHVEAGLRSFDLSMPEEINRMVTDILSSFCFTTSPEAETNLKREGVSGDRIFFVGNIMIDSLLYYMEKAESSDIMERLSLEEKGYILVTMHRPSNVDSINTFNGIYRVLEELSKELPVVFPVHPRTKKIIEASRLSRGAESRMMLIDPAGYLDFVKMMKHARLVLTDSGGIQEETTVLGIPCLTVRNNTERPITIEMGTNRLVGTDPERILSEARDVLSKDVLDYKVPPLWDGYTASRIADILEERFVKHNAR